MGNTISRQGNAALNRTSVDGDDETRSRTVLPTTGPYRGGPHSGIGPRARLNDFDTRKMIPRKTHKFPLEVSGQISQEIENPNDLLQFGLSVRQHYAAAAPRLLVGRVMARIATVQTLDEFNEVLGPNVATTGTSLPTVLDLPFNTQDAAMAALARQALSMRPGERAAVRAAIDHALQSRPQRIQNSLMRRTQTERVFLTESACAATSVAALKNILGEPGHETPDKIRGLPAELRQEPLRAMLNNLNNFRPNQVRPGLRKLVQAAGELPLDLQTDHFAAGYLGQVHLDFSAPWMDAQAAFAVALQAGGRAPELAHRFGLSLKEGQEAAISFANSALIEGQQPTVESAMLRYGLVGHESRVHLECGVAVFGNARRDLRNGDTLEEVAQRYDIRTTEGLAELALGLP